MALSLTESAARLSVTRFLKDFISAGTLTLLEKDGTVLTFEGSLKICPLSVVIKIHNPQFYWKVATEADLGFADAYIHGDFSFVDKDEGLVNIIMIFIACKDLQSSASVVTKWDWLTSLFSFSAWIISAKYIYRNFCRRNTLTQARRNISRHYDMSNEMFSLFMDETMMYSCAIHKSENEDLKVAQMRKISLLIEKARVEQDHEVLEIGSGWGTFAIELVKKTGCKYTGLTLSKEQLKFAEDKVKKAGLEDRIKFLLCDYRELKDVNKYDRIIACEMIEAVGDEYIEEFFRCCDSSLTTNGLLVLQFTAVRDEGYEKFRKCPGFIPEYIFPGGHLFSLSRVTSAMGTASKLSVEHVENIGEHYYQTLRCWRKNFLENQSKILSLGFNEKFIQTWEYYFDYCAAGFKMRFLKNYQIVFSRRGTAFNDPSATIPSAHYL
ncbi:uncharacterized protein LOC104887891 [Beta vulgaris subsp. vulgaris]|uniref:uncharacterized protein LOC104887891 n=1 Tax=Beta vulgaris subsp. vulgaris TaxID=3555 RepID=UPI00203707A4|nr:uncharacterized protein LOC104887891 [Beta vulgaris subsp. vulgaris]